MHKTPTSPRGKSKPFVNVSGAEAVHRVVNAKDISVMPGSGDRSRLIIPRGLQSTQVEVNGKKETIEKALSVQPQETTPAKKVAE